MSDHRKVIYNNLWMHILIKVAHRISLLLTKQSWNIPLVLMNSEIALMDPPKLR